jgi:arsenate reductase (thioredoxin)
MFICQKNSSRSQMAEGFAKNLGKGKIEVSSAGFEASQIHPKTIEVMLEVNIDLSNHTSNALSEFNPEDYYAVISLCGCQVNLPTEWLIQEVFEDWEVEDPDNKSLDIFRCVRNEIKELVFNFIDRLA